MNIFITLLENVNKSRTSADNVSFSVMKLKLLITKIACYITRLFYHVQRRMPRNE
jgi:hypothetical protein